MRRTLWFLTASLILTLVSMEAPELASLTDKTFNDPAPIESTQEVALRSASMGRSPASRSVNREAICFSGEIFTTLPTLPSATFSASTSQAMLHRLVVQRK